MKPELSSGQYVDFLDGKINSDGSPVPWKLVGLFARNYLQFGDEETVARFTGDWTTITGPSGSGKTTLVTLLLHVLEVFQDNSSIRPVTLVNKSYTKNSGESAGKIEAFAAALFSHEKWEDINGRKEPSNGFVIGFHITEESKVAKCLFRASISSFFEPNLTTKMKNPTVQGFDLEQIIGVILMVPQDHGLRVNQELNRKFYASHRTLFGDRHSPNDQVIEHFRQLSGIEIDKKKDISYEEQVLRMTVTPESEKIPQNPFSFKQCSGGQLDAYFSLCGTFGFKVSKTLNINPMIVVLDEPGQNLGAHQREKLREILRKKEGQIIVVTHHIEMLYREELPNNVMRFSLALDYFKLKNGNAKRNGQKHIVIKTVQLSKEKLGKFGDNSIWRRTDLLTAYFSFGLVIVEGESDYQVLQNLQDILGREYFHLKWLVVIGDGEHAKDKQLFAECLDLPYVKISDFDVILSVGSKKEKKDDEKKEDKRSKILQRSEEAKQNAGYNIPEALSHRGGSPTASVEMAIWEKNVETLKDEKFFDLLHQGLVEFAVEIVCMSKVLGGVSLHFGTFPFDFTPQELIFRDILRYVPTLDFLLLDKMSDKQENEEKGKLKQTAEQPMSAQAIPVELMEALRTCMNFSEEVSKSGNPTQAELMETWKKCVQLLEDSNALFPVMPTAEKLMKTLTIFVNKFKPWNDSQMEKKELLKLKGETNGPERDVIEKKIELVQKKIKDWDDSIIPLKFASLRNVICSLFREVLRNALLEISKKLPISDDLTKKDWSKNMLALFSRTSKWFQGDGNSTELFQWYRQQLLTQDNAFLSPFDLLDFSLFIVSRGNQSRIFFWPPAIADIEGLFVNKAISFFPFRTLSSKRFGSGLRNWEEEETEMRKAEAKEKAKETEDAKQTEKWRPLNFEQFQKISDLIIADITAGAHSWLLSGDRGRIALATSFAKKHLNLQNMDFQIMKKYFGETKQIAKNSEPWKLLEGDKALENLFFMKLKSIDLNSNELPPYDSRVLGLALLVFHLKNIGACF